MDIHTPPIDYKATLKAAQLGTPFQHTGNERKNNESGTACVSSLTSHHTLNLSARGCRIYTFYGLFVECDAIFCNFSDEESFYI